MPWRDSEDDKTAATDKADSDPGRRLVVAAVLPTADAIRAYIDRSNANAKAGRKPLALKWLVASDPEQVAYLAARVALDNGTRGTMLQPAALKLGDAIIHHLEMEQLQKGNKAGYDGLTKVQGRRRVSAQNRMIAVRKILGNEGARIEVPAAERLQLGTLVLELLVEATGLFTLNLLPIPGRPNDKSYQLGLTEAAVKWLTNAEMRSALFKPLRLPMLIRPRRWRSINGGGYLRGSRGARFLKPQVKQHLEIAAAADLSQVYEAVNHVQNTSWRINRRLYDVMRQVWDGGGSLGGLPPRRDMPVPEQPGDIDTNEDARKDWRKRAAKVHETNARLASDRYRTQQRLWIAERFVDEEAMWFPHYLDFRGRVYPVGGAGLHPQMDDAGKALLEFAHGLPMGATGGYWLAVHIANLFGVDKVSFADRVAWTYDHSRELIDSALAPLDGDRFWTTADSPWMALAAIIDFVGFLDGGEAYVSHLPIPLDGSNSGLQHFSALLRDPVAGSAVNLTPGATPRDVYAVVAERAQAIVDADEAEDAGPWKGGKVSRAIAKRPTMTFVYSSTRFGMVDMIYETLRELDAGNADRGLAPYLGGADNYKAANYLSYALHSAVSETVSAATGAMKWLRTAAKVASKAQVPIVWNAPDGLPIMQSYRVVYGKVVQTHWLGRKIAVTLAVDGVEIDGRRQANGIAPNFVHSMDGAHLRAVARGAKAAGIDHLAVIHDSFGTHAGNTDRLVQILRDTFVEQYQPNVLERFRDELAAQLPPGWEEDLPPLPEMGSLNLEDTRRAEYAFA